MPPSTLITAGLRYIAQSKTHVTAAVKRVHVEGNIVGKTTFGENRLPRRSRFRREEPLAQAASTSPTTAASYLASCSLRPRRLASGSIKITRAKHAPEAAATAPTASMSVRTVTI